MARYAHSCVVTLTATHSSVDGTGSGILIDTSRGLLVTHASLLGAIVLKDQNLCKEVTTQQRDSLSDDIFSHVSVELILERTDSVRTYNHQENVVLSNYQSALVNSSIRNKNPDLSTHSASIISLFKCSKFENAVKHFSPQSNWKFTDNAEDNTNNVSEKEKHDAEVITFKLLPYFILIKIHHWAPYTSTISMRSPQICQIGEPAEIRATPFGNLFPGVLINSCSRGVISNLTGKNQCLILTDARCIPGSEGGPLYTILDTNRYLTGIIVTSLCWKNSEWIGLSLACSIDDIVESLGSSRTSVKSTLNVTSHTGSVDHISAMFESVPLIKLDNSWGSGVIIDHVKRLVLTCSHVIKNRKSHTVKLKQNRNMQFAQCEVLWHSPPTEQFDLALLSYSSVEKHEYYASTISPRLPSEGSIVYVIGHGVFGAEHNLSPSVTVGVVSKVITINNIPIMIQTTCAVHPGASGGALIDKDGCLVGIVVCNAKDVSTGDCFPHVNMSIPMVTIWPVLQKYCTSGDTSVLNNLHLKNSTINNMWTLGNETSTGVNQFVSRL